MNIDTLMSDMSIQEGEDVISEEVYVSLYQKYSKPSKEDTDTAMECDEKLVEELGLNNDKKETEEEDEGEEAEVVEEMLEEMHVRVKEFFNVHLDQLELKQEISGKKTYRKYTGEQIDCFIDLIAAGSDANSSTSSSSHSIAVSISSFEVLLYFWYKLT